MKRSAQPHRLPPVARGQRIGVFGGSFNPPHDGHRLVAEAALRRLGLQRIWWLVTPGNPLKENRDLPSQPDRMAACRALMHDPRMVITGIEASIGTVYTQQTIAWLRRRLPGVRLVWIMGADSLAGFHRWQRWKSLAKAVPIVVVDRPGATLSAKVAPAARWLARVRLPESRAAGLAFRNAPAWVFLHGPRSSRSSTELRKSATVAKTSGFQG